MSKALFSYKLEIVGFIYGDKFICILPKRQGDFQNCEFQGSLKEYV